MKKILALSTIILYALVSKGQAITYAEDVIDFSSQFSTTSWSAQRATGAPDVYPQYGDLSNAWTSSSEDGSREYLELSFGCAHTANEVWIYETFNPGAVDTVYVQDPSSGLWEIVWSDSAVAQPKETRIFKAVFPETSFAVSEVRIAFNNPAVPGWNEIDAVAIVNSVNEELTADLSVQNIQLTPSSVAPLDTLHISGEVINLGDLCTPANQVNIYLSEDSELDFRDNEPKSIDIDALDSQGLVTFDVSMLLSGDLAIGEYYILVVVDEEERQAESNEENNLVSIPFTLNPPTPDLQIVNVALQDAIIGVEESTELSLSIQNAGTTIAGENVLRIFVSEDDNLTSLDRQVFQTSINLLSPEETVDFTVPLSFSNSEEPGLYYVFTHVDRDNNVQETDESNNIASLTLEFESDLDIQLENLAVSANVTQGADVSLTCDLKNNGSSMLTSASEVKVSFYLSEDEVLDSEELELGTIFSVPDVQLAGSFEVPATVPAGAYFVLAKADVADLIFETNEENNEISAGITISQADVDLVVSDFSIDTTEIRIGMATTLTIEIENQGSVGAPAATYKTYISDDDVLDPSDISIDDDNHPALEPNEVITDDPFLSFQGLTKTGPQYLIVSLDASQVVQESDENNDFAFPINMLPNDSDLKSDDAVLSSTTIMQGELLTVSGTIINGGSQKSSSFPFMIYLSDDDLIDQEDILLHEVSSIAGLDSAESYVFEEDLPIDRFLPVGNYNIILQIGDGSAPEVDQSNNTIVLPFGSTLSAIDLEVQNLMLPDSNVVAAGNSVSISADIVNIGSQQSVLGKYAVYLSVDNQLDLNDRRIEDDEMPGLAQNDVLGVTLDEVEIPLAVEAGTYYLFLFADADFDNPETNDNAITDLNTSNN
ncbi:MAG: hypothetical protein KI790_02000, partial [Cyclobacteriaceae bacterium]|nr:hypothetical protein [Cyclobacteriaceae bacterium HetDA_MAG_MS6]